MKVVAIIGPFRARWCWQRWWNIYQAHALALQVWKLGAIAYCPHTATGLMFGKLPEAQVIEGHRLIMAGHHAAYLRPGWQHSEGSLGDRAVFDQQDKPVFESLSDLKARIQ